MKQMLKYSVQIDDDFHMIPYELTWYIKLNFIKKLKYTWFSKNSFKGNFLDIFHGILHVKDDIDNDNDYHHHHKHIY